MIYFHRAIFFESYTFRWSRPELFCKKCVLRNFTKFIGKHLCQSFFFNKAAGLRPATLLKKSLWVSKSTFSYRTSLVAASVYNCFGVINFIIDPISLILFYLVLTVYPRNGFFQDFKLLPFCNQTEFGGLTFGLNLVCCTL